MDHGHLEKGTASCHARGGHPPGSPWGRPTPWRSIVEASTLRTSGQRRIPARLSQPEDQGMSMRIERTAAILCVLVLGAAACAPLTRPTAPAAPPPMRLLDAGSVTLPTGCDVPAGQPFRVSYVVDAAGRPGKPDEISPPDAPACLKEALRSWVATFRYAPVSEAPRLTADW